jgi:hypothetical protein
VTAAAAIDLPIQLAQTTFRMSLVSGCADAACRENPRQLRPLLFGTVPNGI